MEKDYGIKIESKEGEGTENNDSIINNVGKKKVKVPGLMYKLIIVEDEEIIRRD